MVAAVLAAGAIYDGIASWMDGNNEGRGDAWESKIFGIAHGGTHETIGVAADVVSRSTHR
jgi:hypothetical protein